MMKWQGLLAAGLLSGMVVGGLSATARAVPGVKTPLAVLNQAFKVGDVVDMNPYVPRAGDTWEEKYTSVVKIIAIKDEEPRYKVRLLEGSGGFRDTYAYSYCVRKATRQAENEYAPSYLVGTWKVGMGAARNTVGERDNDDDTRTITIEQSMAAYSTKLTINADGTYVWNMDRKTTLKGRWTASDDPDYPILLKKAYKGDDWQAGPHGGDTIQLRAVAWKLSMWGPRLSKRGTKAGVKSSAKFKVNDAVLTNWNGTWYRSLIREAGNGKYKIHYEGWADHWDEWVDAARVKSR